MKICKGCGEEIGTKNWVYNAGMCKKCYSRQKFREKNPDYQRRPKTASTKEDWLRIIHQRDMVIKKQSNTILSQEGELRHIKLRLRKVRDSLDYLLNHPLNHCEKCGKFNKDCECENNAR